MYDLTNFAVLPYTESNFEVIFKDSNFPNREIASKSHIQYLKTYFSKVVPSTIIVEKEYVDKDFLDDYAYYYVRNFRNYNRYCQRIHFFSNRFTQDDLSNLLEGNDTTLRGELKQENYIGFLVIKPLPHTYIGRTCIRTYPDEVKRHFPTIREFTIHLFGFEIKVTSIPFQEQDSVVAACASIALWSCFQATGHKYQHAIPSPVDITRNAIKYFPFLPRQFPNHGLTFEQIALSFRKYDLEPLLIKSINANLLKTAIYSYVKDRHPIILGLELHNQRTNELIGLHAVTILGFGMDTNTHDWSFTAERMNKIYVHDDQVGPFARMEIQSVGALTTSWGNDCYAIPRFLCIPLTSKIRIEFSSINLICNDLQTLMKAISDFEGSSSKLNPTIIFDCHLHTCNGIKQLISQSTGIAPQVRSHFLQMNLPKHLWRIRIEQSDEWVELGFDATDIEQSEFYIYYISNTDLFDSYFENCLLIANHLPRLIQSPKTLPMLQAIHVQNLGPT